jgi:arginyl-tRNA--protein-N-Asp/Glu arginylyltransferase
MLDIYRKYCEYKQFDSVMPLFEQQFRDVSTEIVGYFSNRKLVAFSLIKLYDSNNIDALQFAWDYETPQLSLGSVSTYLEVEIARREGCQHYYMMGGYEVDSAYKAQLGGFEWWTGQVWSQDRSIYLELCSRDSRIILENHGHI